MNNQATMPFAAPEPVQPRPLKPSQYCTDALPALLASEGISMEGAFGNQAVIRFTRERADACAGRSPIAVLKGKITDSQGQVRIRPYVVCPTCEANTAADASTFHCWQCAGTFRLAELNGQPCAYYTHRAADE